MNRIARRFSLSILTLASTLAAGPVAAETADAAAAPSGMSDAELGHLVRFVDLTNQALDDWSGWEARDQWGMDAYRYQIAFMSYALALQQYHSVPAWREVHRATLDRLMVRMLRKPVWEFWREVSKGKREWDPDWTEPAPSQLDPVAEKNIMYSGHIVHMGALYETFYRDRKWSEPGAIRFEWDENTAFEYDLQKLIGIVHREMLLKDRPGGECVAGVECEPNLIFPECNQHPLLSFMLNDHNAGTSLYPEAVQRLGGFFDCTQMYDPKTKTVAACYRVKQDRMVRIPMPSASADGWTGAFMHVWRPEMVKDAYERQLPKHVRFDPNGKPIMAFDPQFELGLAFFASLAVEVGDTETANKLFAYADENYAPVRENFALHYPHRVDVAKDRVCNTTDRILAMARSNRPGGLAKMHLEPWGDEAFEHPIVEGIDFPRVLVREARWNPDRESLIVALLPGRDAPKETKFRISGADGGAHWELERDGEAVGAVGPDGLASGALARGATPGTLDVSIPLEREIRLELRKVGL